MFSNLNNINIKIRKLYLYLFKTFILKISSKHCLLALITK